MTTRRIEPINLYDEYRENENILTKAFLHLVNCAGINYILYLGEKLKLSVPKEILEISTQQKIKNPKGANIYDGRILVNPFEIIIENKLGSNAINLTQLENLLKYKKNRIQSAIPLFILYITRDKEIPQILKNNELVDWTNWTTIYNLSQEYFKEKPQFEYIYQGFVGIYKKIFYNYHDILNDKLVAIVAGNFAQGQAKNGNIYNCQYLRRFRGAKYFGFIKDRKIEMLYEVNGEPEDDEKNGTSYQLIPRPELLSSPIIVNKTTDYGKPVAFSMGQPRYFHLEDVTSVSTTNELEEKDRNRNN